MDLLLQTNKKEFYIDLMESRYYFPGDTIKGAVVLNLEKPTKTNHIRVTLTGQVQADGANVEVLQTSWFLASSPLNDGKPHLLEAQTHRFPFEFVIPKDSDTAKLPSSLKLSSLLGVSYIITAVHDRPFVPERLSSFAKKEIRLLEQIDVTQPEYCARSRVYEDIQVHGLPDSVPKVRLALTLPSYAVVRGDVLSLELAIKHHQALVRQGGIKVYLIRRVFTGKNRHKLSERKSIKSYELDININESTPQYEQIIHTKLLIPTNTPPTVSEGGRILSVDYSVRVVVNLNDPSLTETHHENYIKLESSVVVGTFPKPSLAIDDDEDDTVNCGEDMDALDSDEPIFTQSTISSDDGTDNTLADSTVQQLKIQNKPLPSFATQPFGSSSSLIIEPTMSHPRKPSILSSSPSNSTTIIDPTVRQDTVNSNDHQRTPSLSSQNTIHHYRHDSLDSIPNVDQALADKYAPMKPNRKSSVSSISSLSGPEPPTTTTTPLSPPPIPLNSRPQPTSSSSSSTVSSFATTIMPDIAAYVPYKSPLLQQQQQQPPGYTHHASSSSTTNNYLGHSSPTFTTIQTPSVSPRLPPPPPNVSYQPSQGTTFSMPTPSHQSSTPPPPPTTHGYTSGLAMPMPMTMPDPTQHYNPSYYPSTPPPPPPPDYYHYQTNPPPPPPQQQQPYHNNTYYGHQSTGSYPSAPSWS